MTPHITRVLIVVNILAFIPLLFAFFSEDATVNLFANWIFDNFTMVPAEIVQGKNLHTLFTSMFLLAALMQAPYPPANLLKSSQETPILQMENIPPKEEVDGSQSEIKETPSEDAEVVSQPKMSLSEEEPATSNVEVAATVPAESPA